MQSLRAGRQEQSLTETQIQSLRAGRQEQSLTETQIQRVWELCSKRLQRMPVQYVIEEWDFRELTLKMRPPVFIPRPETEASPGIEASAIMLTFTCAGCCFICRDTRDPAGGRVY
ncbi:UNVERIFIED_CONTAM: hypothetical protein FKN15_015900 [Acipenser sinensis]